MMSRQAPILARSARLVLPAALDFGQNYTGSAKQPSQDCEEQSASWADHRMTGLHRGQRDVTVLPVMQLRID
jgi:hypothetical protein